MLVFVYGTLTDQETAASILESFEYVGQATLIGLQCVEGEYPTLAPGGRTTGRLLRTPEIGRLDAYEGVDRGLYVRVSVPVAGEDISGSPSDSTADPATASTGEPAAVYAGDPDLLDAPADWPGDGLFPDRLDAYLESNDVHIKFE